ncbi:MAG TPA: aldolase/citrate lyase family protein [Chloroflexota bacterium]|nr:aldolase/citrate lyase family protein [Chloroflexota bacterium]
MTGLNVRISLASAEADLEAVVWPGVSTVYCPRVESAAQLRAIDDIVGRLERLRGIRPGTVRLQPLIESARGVVAAGEIAPASARTDAFGPGPKLSLHLDAERGEALAYARDECELVARAFELEPVSTEYLGD